MRLTRARLILALGLSASVAHGADPVVVAAPGLSAGASSPSAGSAPAPAPGSTGPEADILNTLEARAATFVNASTLVLAGLFPSVQWVVDGSEKRQTGKIPVAKWLGPDFQKNGSWLANPAAVMHASVKGGNDTTFVLQLSNPVYNSTANSLYLGYAPVTSASQLALQRGAANTAIASPSTSAPPVGVLLQDVALFVDDALPVTRGGADPNLQGGTKLGFEPLGGGFGRRGGTSNAAGTYDSGGDTGRSGGLVNVGLGGCYYPGGFNNFGCNGYGYYGGAFG